jgi:hypothetical protein
MTSYLSSFFEEYKNIEKIDQDCPVCYETLMNIDILEPCNHKVHLLCVEKHMKQTLDQPICPLCRVIVTNIDQEEEEEEDIEYENEDEHGLDSNLFYILDNLPDMFSNIADLHSVHFHLHNTCYNDVSQLSWRGYSFIECLLAICMTYNQIPECLSLEDVLYEEMRHYTDNIEDDIQDIEEYCKYAKILIDYSKNIYERTEFPAKIGKPFFKFCLWMSDIAA